MNPEPDRSRAARQAAESALVRVVHEYGRRPEFVVLGGLVPELLCSASDMRHAGTTDIDVQVNLEIASGSVNAASLEQALVAAGFSLSEKQVWRWVTTAEGLRAEVKFEMLVDLDDKPSGAMVAFDDCDQLGAANLRGTRFAAADFGSREMTAAVGDAEGSGPAVHLGCLTPDLRENWMCGVRRGVKPARREKGLCRIFAPIHLDQEAGVEDHSP